MVFGSFKQLKASLRAAFLALSAVGCQAADTPGPGGWVYHPLAGTRCLNSLGVPSTGSQAAPPKASVLYRDAPANTSELYLYVQGGGSCSSASQCKKAPPANTDADGYSVDDFLAPNNNKLIQNLYLRNAPVDSSPRVSPFAGMNMSMIPYCTGDMHTGNAIRTFGGKDYYFAGNSNFQIAFKWLLDRYPDVTTIWLMGTSAGGVGANVQYSWVKNKLKKARPNLPTQVHLIEDSSAGVTDPDSEDLANNLKAWKSFLPGCESQAAEPPPDVTPATASEPFPSSAEVSALALQINESGADSAVMQTTTGRQSCGNVQATRLYNRGLDVSFRYGFIDFEWDQVQNPFGMPTAPNLTLFLDKMRDMITQVENPLLSNWSRHLYVGNSEFRIAGTDTLCPRHVVTNFRPEAYPVIRTEIEDAHFGFISNMINSPASWVSDVSTFSECPRDISDVTPD